MIADRIRLRPVPDHLPDAGHFLGQPGLSGFGEPALNGGVGHGLHALLADQGDTFVPDVPGAHAGGRGAEQEGLQPLRIVPAQHLTDHAPFGQAAEINPVQIEPVQETHRIPAEHLHGIRPLRDSGLSEAAAVVAQHPTAGLQQGRHLGVPHGKIRGQGIGQHDHRPVFRSVQAVVNMGGVDVG